MRRRTFLEKTAKVSAVLGFLSLSTTIPNKIEMKKLFIHHVLFWLKDPGDSASVKQFEAALKKLVTINDIAEWHLGKPASTRREVIDSTYQYSLLTMFKDKAAHDAYQVHPVHDDFRTVANELCSRVQIYDSTPME